MRFTVLGKSPAFEDRGGACSSYLVQEGGYRLLIDCGNAAFAKLREHADHREIDTVLLSHLHADHFLDLIPYSYALTLGTAPEGGRRPELLVPDGAAEKLRSIVATWGSRELIDSAFELTEYETAGRLELGPIRARLHPVPHYTLTHAVELIAPSGGRIVYGADCRAGEELVAAARGADILLAEATLAEPDPAPLLERGHMSPAEAGAVAREAGVGRLVLTHFSDQLEEAGMLAAARESFGGEVEATAEGRSYEV